jgi:hypothetical protein
VLVARLSLQAIHEKAEVSCLINSTHLQQHPDERSSFFAANGHRLELDTSQFYRTSTQSGHRSQSYSFVWKNYATPRVKFFGWLLLQERIHCRANLAKINILDDAMCELCGQSEEDCEHLIFRCPVASSLWAHLGWDMNQLPPISNLWEIPRPDQGPVHPTLLFSLFFQSEQCFSLISNQPTVFFQPAYQHNRTGPKSGWTSSPPSSCSAAGTFEITGTTWSSCSYNRASPGSWLA